MTHMRESPLGRSTEYPDRYDASLLFTIPRESQRAELGLRGALPFSGADLWTAYELSWLDLCGKPQVTIAHFRVPAESPAIVESKSLKLYLGSFAQERVATSAELTRVLETDLARACGAGVRVTLLEPSRFASLRMGELPGESLDSLEVTIDAYEPQPDALIVAGGSVVEESLRSSLFRSTCPITGQPDYADVFVRYAGSRIDRAGMLRYLISYRCHAGFHEQCVERIFVDISGRCRPQRLTVYARFMRRGGLDINPFRSSFEPAPENDFRVPRQ